MISFCDILLNISSGAAAEFVSDQLAVFLGFAI